MKEMATEMAKVNMIVWVAQKKSSDTKKLIDE